MNDELTIDDLCAETGHSRRTIRYYLQRGLIPPPEGGGRRRIYRNEHMLRLMAIKALQGRRYPLDEIRYRLSDLSETGLADLLEKLKADADSVCGVTSNETLDRTTRQEEALPIPPPDATQQVVIAVTDGVNLVAEGPTTPQRTAQLIEAARRAAEVLLNRPVDWMPHQDPMIEAHLKRLRTTEEDRERQS